MTEIFIYNVIDRGSSNLEVELDGLQIMRVKQP